MQNDLHEPHRSITSLTAYKHLRRIFRLCRVHVERNIKKVAVPEPVKTKMRSLICIKHDFDGCLREIELEGGKAGAGMYFLLYLPFDRHLHADFSDWVQDKRRSKFALAGICWQLSYIPISVWRIANSTTNIIESLHADANSEGIFCSLVGGMKKGHHFDTMKLQPLEVSRTNVFSGFATMVTLHLRYLKLRAFNLRTNTVTFHIGSEMV